MKNFKKIASAIAALSLAACVAVPMSATVFTASAATKVTVTDSSGDTAEHTYTIYQIFTGTYSKDVTTSEETLSNIGWADDFDSENLLKDTEFAKLLESDVDTLAGKSVAEISKLMGEKCATPAKAEQLARILGKHVGKGTPIDKTDGADVDAGYYIVKDTYTAAADAESGNDKPGSTSFHMLGVISGTGKLPIATKKGLPSFEKKLKDVNDSTGAETEWQDSADYDIGDSVPFQLKATLPSDYNRYTKYTLKFHDDFRKNSADEVFTFGGIDRVYIDKNANGKYDEGEDLLTSDMDYTLSGGASDATDLDNFDVVITDLKQKYETATDTDGKMPNVIVEYHATLNDKAALGKAGNWNDAYLEYSNNPNYSGSGEGDTTDKTPKDSVVVFTYKTTVNKVKPDGRTALEGAKFSLYKQYNSAQTEKGDNKADALSKTGEYWYEVKAEAEWSEATTSFSYKGLDDGNYILVEDEAPDGYNKLAKNIEFTVTATHTNDIDSKLELTELQGSDKNTAEGSLTFSANEDLSELSTKVVNEKGATLPSTGGIGTTLFYLGGGALVAVAGVMLITKKRMTKE